MKTSTLAFLSGFLFALVLVVGGMIQPQRIQGFLDFFGNWDPSLAFVMAGAVGVNFFVYRAILKREHPLWAPRFYMPTRRDITPGLVLGSALFGVGWGLGGYCPAPAVVGLITLDPGVWVFVVAMIGGIGLRGLQGQR
jgi:uncharacterized membrane protein YedE/YeeE